VSVAPLPSDAWLPYARQDWSRTRLLLREHDPAGAGMHLQQAVEKYLKGWLLDRGWLLRKTHEADRLLDDATRFDPSLHKFHGLCERLSDYYLVDRYPPAGLQGPDEAQMIADIDEARQLVMILFPGESI
jgi:HEPN domain-containing protein